MPSKTVTVVVDTSMGCLGTGERVPVRLEGHLQLGRIHLLLFQSLHLESERQPQQEDELQKPALQPPYYDLGVSPSYHPLVRMTEL